MNIITSTDGGATWSAPALLDGSMNHLGICCMSTAVSSNGRAIISYFNKGAWRLMYSDDDGAGWTASGTAPNFGDGLDDVAAGDEGSFVGAYGHMTQTRSIKDGRR